MKQFSTIIACSLGVVMAVGLMAGCGGKNVSRGAVPDWFLNPPQSKEKVYGTGASEKTASVQAAKTVADAASIDEVARSIQVSVQNMTRTFLQQSGTLEASRALQFSEIVSKQVVDMTLTGVMVEKREIKDGRCYSLASISMDSVKKSLMSAIQDAAAQFSEQKARQAFKDLEGEVQKGNIPILKPE